MKKKLTNEEKIQKFGAGIDCSQIVLSSVCDKLGISEEEALKMSACFGGGMWHGETCGCVIGALIALGIKYGNSKPNDKETKDLLLAKKAEFEEKFSKVNKGCLCREILGYNLSVPEEMAKIQEENLLQTRCPEVVQSAIKILREML